MTDKYEVRDDEMDQVVGGITGTGNTASVKSTAATMYGKGATSEINKNFSEKQ